MNITSASTTIPGTATSLTAFTASAATASTCMSTNTIDVPRGFYIPKEVIIDGCFYRDVKEPSLIALSEVPKIKDYAIYNGRAVKVEFEDGTFTKCVCDADTEFDFYTGFAFCLIKKMLGKEGHKKFNDIMRKAVKQLDKIDRAKDEAEQEEARRKEKKRKAALKKAEKAEKARQEQIDIMSAGVMEAMKKIKAECPSDKGGHK